MRALLATALILVGALLLGACTSSEEGPEESSTATRTPTATIKATRTTTATPVGAAVSATPRHLVGRPAIPSPTPTATPVVAPTVQTVVTQPTEVVQATVVPQPTAPPPTAPPPTVVVVTVVAPTPTPPTPTPVATSEPPPAVTAPIVFRGTVVDAPEKQEPIDGPCGYSWWVVHVAVSEVIKNEQGGGGCGSYAYTVGEIIDVLYFAEYVPVGSGEYVEVSGEEGMFSCACECCCDGCGLLVRVEIAGSYIRSL